MSNLKPIKKMKPHEACHEGQHTYVVTAWQIGNGKEKAVAMRCQHCLMPLDLEELNSAEWSKRENI